MKVEIELTNEQVADIKKELEKSEKMPKMPFEAVIDNIRICEKARNGWPIRISFLGSMLRGAKRGQFPQDNNTGSLPGDVLSINQARNLAQAILDCVAAVENKGR